MINLSNLPAAQAIHDKICLLYMKLEGCAGVAQRVTEFDCEVGVGNPTGNDREILYKQLVDALWNYEEVTGREDHPVNGLLEEIAV